MKLYHGTNQDIESIDVHAGLKYKDFGQGFYLTPDLETAERMAEKKAKLFGGTPTIITYEYTEPQEHSGINVKAFPEKATAEWFKFIYKNRDRHSTEAHHDFDIVSGPIADDGVVLQLSSYRTGVIKQAEDAAVLLQDKYLDQQYCFCSQKSVSLLKKKGVCQKK